MAINRILVPIDFSSHSRAAAELGLALARAHEATLMLFHADHVAGRTRDGAPTVFPVDVWRSYRKAHAQSVRTLVEAESAALRASAENAPDVTIEVAVQQTDVNNGILAQADGWGADLIVMGSRGVDEDEVFLFGSVSARVVREASCPVIVTHADNEMPVSAAGFSRPLVAIDYSEFSIPAANLAVTLSAPSAALDFQYVWQPPKLPHYELSPGLENPELESAIEASDGYLTERLRKLVGQVALGSLAASCSVKRGRIARTILDSAAEGKNDLIVMGAHTPHSTDGLGFTGATTGRVLQHAKVPVAVIPRIPQE